MERGRLIPLMVAPGAMHMAIDRWLLQQHRLGHQPPILRFYGWDPPALSLGYHQHPIPAHWHHLTIAGCPLQMVRRPSGGRAVLHLEDLTYGLILSGLPLSRRQAYAHLCGFLVAGWGRLGVAVTLGRSTAGSEAGSEAGSAATLKENCFATATTADLVLGDGCKLIGSAQWWQGDAVLQHGSMALGGQAFTDCFAQVFGVPWPDSQERDRARQIPRSSIMAALIAASAETLGICFEPEPLTPQEWAAISELCSDQFMGSISL